MNFISHRGKNKNNLEENTIDIISETLKYKYISGVEFDIRFTKDKKIILYHNMLINIKGKYSFVKLANYKEILKYNPSICLLDNLLNEIKTDKILLIEIKEESDNYIEFINKIYTILKKYNFNYYICSFNYDLLMDMKKRYNKFKYGLIIGYLMNINKITSDFDFYLYKDNYLKYINENKEIFIFNVNNREQLKKILTKINYNCYIITDKAYLFN